MMFSACAESLCMHTQELHMLACDTRLAAWDMYDSI